MSTESLVWILFLAFGLEGCLVRFPSKGGYTFGTPGLGDDAYSRSFKDVKSYLVVDNQDLVATTRISRQFDHPWGLTVHLIRTGEEQSFE